MNETNFYNYTIRWHKRRLGLKYQFIFILFIFLFNKFRFNMYTWYFVGKIHIHDRVTRKQYSWGAGRNSCEQYHWPFLLSVTILPCNYRLIVFSFWPGVDFSVLGKQQFFIGDLKLNRNISSIKYNLKFTSYTWHQIINCLDLLN